MSNVTLETINRVEVNGQRWETLQVINEDGIKAGLKAYHVDCDCFVDEDNNCYLCGSTAPLQALWSGFDKSKRTKPVIEIS